MEEDGALPQPMAQVWEVRYVLRGHIELMPFSLQTNQTLRETLFGADSDEEEEILNEIPEHSDVKRKAQASSIASVSYLIFCTTSWSTLHGCKRSHDT